MAEWVRIMLALVVAWAMFYSTVQMVVYRVDKLERDFATHQEKHDEQYKEIMSNIIEIKMHMVELSEKKKSESNH